ncbi:hypothetical protein [Deinococcus aquatilis]|uniref:hypothetical protein n=1 Tax=Deinococcus aquatilis TaxID=519440 RepID=UPI00035C37E4|nr:hypothetical protein [Deinococcus aquatilis]
MADLASTIIAARVALLKAFPPGVGPPIFLERDPDPPGEQAEAIILQPVSDTALPAYGLRPTTKLIQVTCYAPTLLRALSLTTEVTAALRPLGLRFIQSRPAPDPEFTGQVSDYRA